MAEKKTASAKREVKTAPPFSLSTGWAAAILALLVILFFHEVSVGGRTFVSPDATNPVGFVRIGEHSLWQDKVYPLWNPFVFLGMPSFGSGAYNPLIYPPDWPLALLQKVLPLPDLTWMLLYYFLGGLFTYLLAREWGARSEGALLGAVAFVFQPNLVAVGSHGHGSQLVNSAYLPLMVWLAARWFRRGSVTDLGLLALAGGFQFLRGHLQICFYTWIAIGLLAVVQIVATLRTPGELAKTFARAAALGVAAGLAFGLAGVYNLPLKDYAQYSIRGGGDGGGAGLAYATGWSMAPYELLSAIVPNWVGFGGGTYWGGMPFTDYPNAYLGVVAVLLALPAFLPASPGSGRVRAYALVMALFALFVSFGRYFPLYGFLYDHVPQFNKFRIPVMIVLLFQLSAALAGAWGWSAVLEQGARGGKRDPALDRVMLGAAALLVVAGLLALAGSEAMRGGYVSMATSLKAQFPPDAANAAFQGFVSDLGRTSLLGLLAVGLAWLAAGGRVPAAAASLGLLVLLALDTWPISSRVMQPVIGDPVQKSLDYGRDDVVEWLEKAGPWGTFRVFAPYERDNRMAGFGVSLLGGYHAAKPRLYQDLIPENSSPPLIMNPRWWALLNVKYLVMPQAMTVEQLGEVLGPAAQFFQVAYTGAAGTAFEYLPSLPRVTLCDGYAVVPDTGRAAIDSVETTSRDFGHFTFVTKDPGVQLGPITGGTAKITHYGLHDVKVDVDTPGPAILRLADLWYPDWTVRVDGKPATLLRADHALRAVVVPAGRHAVEFAFFSKPVFDGLRLSLTSLVTVLAMIGAGLWLGRRKPKGAPEAAPAGGA